jgi:hypothetical protein
VNKLRDQLGVKVDVSDDVDEKEKEGGKKKKAIHQKSRVKVKTSKTRCIISNWSFKDHGTKGERRRGQEAYPCTD